eukprot:gene13843-16322_t
MQVNIPSEPIGSVPRPKYLQDAMANKSDQEQLKKMCEKAVKETVAEYEENGEELVCDGEQSKPSFVTYPLDMTQMVPGGATIPFADGHTRQLPVLKNGPFRYKQYAGDYVKFASSCASRPIKQCVISPSAMSLLYPASGIADYPHETFITDVVNEVVKDIRSCFAAGASVVQIDATELRLSLLLDPSGSLLQDFISLNNRVLSHFSEGERANIGLHSCPGGDQDSTHSAMIPYTDLLPSLFKLNVGRLYLEFAGEADRISVLKCIAENIRPTQRVFLGVVNVINPRIESAQEVCDTLVEASQYIPPSQLGSCDDCGFSPFGDDVSTPREIAFGKMKARIDGTKLAMNIINQSNQKLG